MFKKSSKFSNVATSLQNILCFCADNRCGVDPRKSCCPITIISSRNSDNKKFRNAWRSSHCSVFLYEIKLGPLEKSAEVYKHPIILLLHLLLVGIPLLYSEAEINLWSSDCHDDDVEVSKTFILAYVRKWIMKHFLCNSCPLRNIF